VRSVGNGLQLENIVRYYGRQLCDPYGWLLESFTCDACWCSAIQCIDPVGERCNKDTGQYGKMHNE
jgi:hypothetical protein